MILFSSFFQQKFKKMSLFPANPANSANPAIVTTLLDIPDRTKLFLECPWNHSFSAYVKVSEKLTFLIP